jgi:hypothetical protein
VEDTRIVELRGRPYLLEQLLSADLEIAIPQRDHGIDMIVFADRGLKNFAAKPIQIKASSGEGFESYKKYAKTSELVLAFV